MLDYGAAALNDGLMRGPQWTAYVTNLVASAASNRVWSFLAGRRSQINLMRDGLLLTSAGRNVPQPMVEAIDWPDVTAIDLSKGPVRITTRSGVHTIHGFDKADRLQFYDAIAEARMHTGLPPSHVTIAGTGTLATARNTKKRWAAVLEWGVTLAVIGAIVAHINGSAAVCKPVAAKVDADVFLINGEPDAGFTVHATIANTGKEGPIKVKAVLTTSEGTFTREQSVSFPENATRVLDFGFPEPTINATNVQGVVSCSP